MQPRQWSALVAVAVTALLVIAPAAGRLRPGPNATIACANPPGAPPGQLCSEKGSINVPGNSFASQSTDTVPGQASQAKIFVVPSVDTVAGFNSVWTMVVAGNPSLGNVKSTFVQKLIVCDLIAATLTNIEAEKAYTSTENVSEHQFTDSYAATLYVCLAIAFSQPPPGGAPAHAAAALCQAAVAAPIQIARSGSGYLVSANGTTSKAKRPPVVVSCGRQGRGIVLTLKPRRRGKKLRQLIGPHLSIGFANRGTSSVHLATTYTFKK
jgi:hypothetical protein